MKNKLLYPHWTALALLGVAMITGTGCKMGQWKAEAANSATTIERLRGDSATCTADLRTMRTEFLGLQDDAQLTREQLAERAAQLRTTEEELRVKAKRMDDLDGRLRAQTEAMSSLRKKVTDALVNFKAEELSISERDGKIYVSLSEKLLFASGSAKVDPKGSEALGKLAEVLRANADIHVMVEGHTDTIPIRTSKFTDNWDLSTARAVSIVRSLTTKYQVPADRVQATGCGQLQPIASNADAEGRARNRRTEIILVPRLEELYEMIGTSDASKLP